MPGLTSNMNLPGSTIVEALTKENVKIAMSISINKKHAFFCSRITETPP
jgi:hypothetical protein